MSNEQVDFSLWANFDNWSLKDALFIIKTYVKERAIARGDDEDAIKRKQSYVHRKFDSGFDEFTDEVKYRTEYDEEGHEVIDGDGYLSEAVDYGATTVNKMNFIKWAYRERIPLPDDIMNIVRGNGDRNAKEGKAPATECASEENYEFLEYKGLSLEDLTKEKFEEIKKSYGMLNVEANKFRKTIPIATQIGLLFYEHGLAKPATNFAFKREYKKHFGGVVPQRMADMIYEALPDKYQSLAGDNANKNEGVDDDTLDTIIEASAFAGYLCHKEGIVILDDVENRLTEDEYELPADNYLNAIKKACKKVMRKYV